MRWYRWYCTIVYAIGIAFCAALAIYPKQAPAQELLSARGLVCDTAEQVARVITADDFYETLASVNAEKADSCNVLEVAFIIHNEKGPKVFIGADAWQLTEIIVVAANTPQGMVLVEPMIQWSAFHVDEHGVRSSLGWCPPSSPRSANK
jgi:hypothetical protein